MYAYQIFLNSSISPIYLILAFAIYNFIIVILFFYLKKIAKVSIANTKAKSIFLSNMSHEIRTPLNAIIGMGELLEKANLTEEEKNFLKILRNASDNLLILINDILDLSKIEEGKINFDIIPFSVSSILEETIKLLKQSALQKNLILTYDIQDEIKSLIFEGDPFRLKQIIINLISNALKFTLKGYVYVSLEICTDDLLINKIKTYKSDNELIYILFTVKDTGIGIPIDKWDTIFESFSQADESTTRKYGGTGLGLAITRNIIDLLGGRIWVESFENQGSIFYSLIPFSIAKTFTLENYKKEYMKKDEINNNIQKAELASNSKVLDILVAEDNPDNQYLLEVYIKSTPHKIKFVNNGLEAVKSITEKRYDLIFMDIQMPIMDGLKATKRIRLLENIAKKKYKNKKIINKIPIYALTAHALKQEVEKTKNAGCDGHILKPLKKAEFFDIISKHAA